MESSYLPPFYRGLVTLLEAESQRLGRAPGARFGWDQFCDGEVEIRTVPGDHSSMLTAPHVEDLARVIAECLRGVDSQGQSGIEKRHLVSGA